MSSFWYCAGRVELVDDAQHADWLATPITYPGDGWPFGGEGDVADLIEHAADEIGRSFEVIRKPDGVSVVAVVTDDWYDLAEQTLWALAEAASGFGVGCRLFIVDENAEEAVVLRHGPDHPGVVVDTVHDQAALNLLQEAAPTRSAASTVR
jgi:hypothetical protein